MKFPDDPYEEFTVEKWERDYGEEDPEEVAALLSDPWTREMLLQDYEQASADGRHRNQLIHYSFYIGLVVLGLILNLGWQMWTTASYFTLAIIFGLGGSLHWFLYVWGLSAKNSRDASWDRRSEIEDMVKLVEIDVLRSNDSTFKRLTRIDDGQYYLPGKEGAEKVSVGRYIVDIHRYISGCLVGLAVLVVGWRILTYIL